jgi:hypothetical protein
MGFPISNGTTAGDLRVEADKAAARVIVVPRGNGYSASGVTGTVAAALGANSAVFAMRLDPGSSARAYIDRVRLQYTCLVAFTVPLTAGRRLALFRGSGAATAGGASMGDAVPKHTTHPASEFNIGSGGDLRIATTGALTVTGITWEAQPIATMPLVHVGNAGNYAEALFEFAASESYEVVLEPGQVLGIRNPAVMDAAGTWQLGVGVQWREVAAYS